MVAHNEVHQIFFSKKFHFFIYFLILCGILKVIFQFYNWDDQGAKTFCKTMAVIINISPINHKKWAEIFSPEMAFLLLGPIILSTLGTPPHFPHFMDLTGKRIAELCTHSASQKRIKIVPQYVSCRQFGIQLDIFFRQITTFIKVCMAFIFRLQTL